MKVKFTLPENVDEITKAIVVVTTPKGIVSARFDIKPKKHQKNKLIVKKQK